MSLGNSKPGTQQSQQTQPAAQEPPKSFSMFAGLNVSKQSPNTSLNTSSQQESNTSNNSTMFAGLSLKPSTVVEEAPKPSGDIFAQLNVKSSISNKPAPP